MKLLVNASNLHVGGGVQVATSFVSELNKLLGRGDSDIDVSVIVSEKVYKNLSGQLANNNFSKFLIANTNGIERLPLSVTSELGNIDICFTIFGPVYFKTKAKIHVTGFGQAWIAYPNNEAYKVLGVKEYLFNKLKFMIQWHYFKTFDHLIVEQNHVKTALIKRGIQDKAISVVSNCVSNIFNESSSWESLEFDPKLLAEQVTIGFVGRAYIHKNVEVLKEVNRVLIEKFNLKCNFIFTFNELEMERCGFAMLENFHTVGEITVSQCPNFYKLLDFLIFPSLLECFSAAPIEAIKMNVPVLASDRPFVREVCGESAFYFDPECAESIAKTIYFAVQNENLKNAKLELGSKLMKTLPDAKNRTQNYLRIFEQLYIEYTSSRQIN